MTFSSEAVVRSYWESFLEVRRSIAIAKHLRDIGDNYRGAYLHSNDISDRTVSPSIVEHLGPGSSWLRPQWPLSPALGGPYVAVHWRRGDFVTTTAQQILNAVKIFNQYEDHKIDTIYLATDANKEVRGGHNSSSIPKMKPPSINNAKSTCVFCLYHLGKTTSP
ncbi:unnamed protein product [Schistosoma margrebowiei]|uniref:Peptide-O-fucosyltransferase n=1 Tax=Schistosoma margrebowiei TaxID=48269 RepID=A0AA84ZT57_9TREM|nr:unnamed protein product [Schistosoma margrebowiei]